MRPRCSVEACPELCVNDIDSYGYNCVVHGFHPAPELEDWNEAPMQVWLRSREVSYSSVVPRRNLLVGGAVRAPGLEEFKWERWPTAPEPNRSR